MAEVFYQDIRRALEATDQKLRSNTHLSPGLADFDSNQLADELKQQASYLEQYLQSQPNKDWVIYQGMYPTELGPLARYRQKATAILVETLVGVPLFGFRDERTQVAKIPNTKGLHILYNGIRHFEYQVPTLSPKLLVLFRYQELGFSKTRFQPAQIKLAKFPDYVGIRRSP